MKTNHKLFRTIGTMLFAVTVLAGFTACETDTVEQNGGKLPDKEAIESTYGMLRSNASTGNTVEMLLTAGTGFVTRDFYYQQTKPAADGTTLTLRIDESLVEGFNATNGVECQLLPTANCEFPDGQTLELAADGQRTASKRVRISVEGLTAGEYLLPVTVAAEGSADDSQTLYYTLTVRDPQPGDYELHDGSDLFFVFYINTDQYQPLLVQDYLLEKKLARGSTVAWYGTVGNIINLRTVSIKYDETSGRAMLDLGSDMTYVLGHASKYIWPLQESGRKVCLSLEGGGTGLGFCNLTDEQIADFVAQVKAVVETYNLDGINLWDRNAGYGKEGMPETNTTSYPKLVKAMREAIGPDKLLTLTVYEEPTATFWDTEATGGITVGDYLDYAWSGYNSYTEAIQLLDPWHPNESYVSAYTQKPIAGLDASKFGCVNFPIYPQAKTDEETLMRDPSFLIDWIVNEQQPNKIVVFDDLRTSLQDNYETVWDVTFADCCMCMDDENKFILGSRNGYTYRFDNHELTALPTGLSGYGKWLKDW